MMQTALRDELKGTTPYNIGLVKDLKYAHLSLENTQSRYEEIGNEMMFQYSCDESAQVVNPFGGRDSLRSLLSSKCEHLYIIYI